ncbi:MAG: toll/interleukin-1 receptor domain-containing protein [Sphingomicrobium sp.]
MAKLAQLPANDGAPDTVAANARRLPRLEPRYYAFLSYSHNDKALADWLHRELERFRVPHALAGRLTANGVVPKRLTPIFRDQHDLAATGDLGGEIKTALAVSQFLIVLCSPTAAISRWTNAEIEWFKQSRPDGCVLAAIVGGEPFASEVPGREKEECFPPALRYKYDRRGRPTGKRAEPLAADFREGAEGKRTAFLKLVAGMLGVGLDELAQRETTRRHRRLAWLTAASLGGMAVTSTLSVVAVQSRNEAREQRREAEGLVGFMLGDLKDKLQPIGRLDALDGVGSRVLAYYQKQGTADLSDAALSQRSRALSLMAQVADSRGDADGSLRLYREAMAGTSEAIRRNPDDPQALFDHAQNVFYVGQIAQLRGDFRTAEASMREYKRLALRMVALGPDSMKWRMEEQYADANLGIVLYDQRRFAEAATQFSEALRTIEAISTADPASKEYRKAIGESLAWLADAQSAIGRYDDAISARQRDIALLDDLLARTGDVDFRQRLIPAHRALGNLYAERSQRDLAIEQFRFASAHADRLTAIEPNNTQWLEYGYLAHIDLGKQLLSADQADAGASEIRSACQTVRSLLARDSRNPAWRQGLTACLVQESRLSLRGGQKESALAFARQAVEVARSLHTGDATNDAFALAKALRLVGDTQREFGNSDAARSAWTSAFAALPVGVAEQPGEIAERLAILKRIGRITEAQQLARKLTAMGFRGSVT